MRKYVPKGNVQKKAYYTDRFHVVPSTPREKVETDAVYAAQLKALEAKVEVKSSRIELNCMVVEINHEDNFKALEALKEECGYAMLSEMSAVDYLAKDGNFEVFYQMLNLKEVKRLRLVMRIEQGLAVESAVPLFNSANFAEREMFDMFGIVSNNHPFMKRILMPDDWEGNPLLKTYPLHGDEFASWYEVDKIFGKDAREAIGPENRDEAKVERYDSKRFSRIGYEVPFGAEVTPENETETAIEYSKTFLVDYTKGDTKQLKERK
ncbi:MAG: NADH-ubiquinone oxidoreductase chain C (EC [uncultured Sulfurovum sp.]|uniref:NADH-quinone oxidoreductase n=1 Tax=uncultured Sulfurovum sp. TaxID=269237 RepID=A0A6S6TR12_9BACT|nr:MAG: NADH-ubiquinone oxidoreductase chain C (EC [uncultured Sulfurovum sp.]